MGFSTFSHARLTGVSVVVPKNKINLEDELEYFGGSLKKVERTKKMIGLGTRRVADRGVTAADLCEYAARNLLEEMKCDKTEIDALIFISQGPDYAIPATACILQDKLGLPQTCAAFDVNQGCTAYTYGLWMASSFIDSKACKKVLLLVGEAGASYSDPANRIITPIFGDCGSATLLEYSEEIVHSYFPLGTDGSGAEALIVPAGHARFPLPPNGEDYEKFITPIHDSLGNPWYLSSTYMDGGAIFNFTMSVVPDHIKSLLAYASLTPEQVDWLVLHQANKQIASAIASKSGFPDSKAPTETVAKYGNQSGASLPSVLCDQLSEIIKNQSTKALLSGFGVGLSWASAIIDLNRVWCPGVLEFETPKEMPSTDEMIDYWQKKMSR